MFDSKEIRYSLHSVSQGSGPPVILIHGLGGSLRQWDQIVPRLTAAGFSAHALDLPGHGDSAKPEEAHQYHIDVFYDQFDYWLRDLPIYGDPLVIIGHSLGAYLSILFTLRHPDRVRALVLTDPFYSPKQLPPIIQFAMRRPKPGVKIFGALPSWAFDLAFDWTNQKHSTSQMRRQLALDLKRASPRILYTTRTVRDLSPAVQHLHTPTLVIWGKQDMTLSPTSFPPLVRRIAEAESHVFPECGHIPHLTRAATFNQLVLDFIERKNTRCQLN